MWVLYLVPKGRSGLAGQDKGRRGGVDWQSPGPWGAKGGIFAVSVSLIGSSVGPSRVGGWGGGAEQQVPEQDCIKGWRLWGAGEGSVTRLRSKVSAWPSSQADL